MDVRHTGASSRTWRLCAWSGSWLMAAVLLAVAPASAIYLDQERNLNIRMRAYTQAAIATQGSYIETDPPKGVGNLMQHRTFFNPEFDAKWEPYLQKWGMGWFDEFTTRLALWGFYDGLYDYGPEAYANRAAQAKFHYDAQGNPYPHGGWQTKGYSVGQAMDGRGFNRNVRDIYSHRYRVNEAYVSMSKGPFFLRIGRQAISWGEADTIGLLDANNPFDTTILPGVFIDLDEARIPLWTARATYQAFSSVGPFSSGFFDMYIVPGFDTTVSPLQVSSGSPYSLPPPAGSAAPPAQEVFQLRPQQKFGNSRWGIRFQTVIARNYTTSVWFYKTFQTAPVPVFEGLSPVTSRIVVSLNQALTNVAGVATTFFLEPLNSIVRAEVEVFNNEAGFNVASNFAPLVTGQKGKYQKINVIRGELGLDRNLFIRPLNPSTSFIWVMAFVFTAVPDDTKFNDFRANGFLKASAIRRQAEGGAPAGSVIGNCNGKAPGTGCDFVNQQPFEFFVQSHLETSYMHGRLTPAVTGIINNNGALVLFPEVTYRVTDSFLLSSRYVNIHTFGSINSGFVQLGGARDRDQIWFRATYQLN